MYAINFTLLAMGFLKRVEKAGRALNSRLPGLVDSALSKQAFSS